MDMARQPCPGATAAQWPTAGFGLRRGYRLPYSAWSRSAGGTFPDPAIGLGQGTSTSVSDWANRDWQNLVSAGIGAEGLSRCVIRLCFRKRPNCFAAWLSAII